MNLPRIFDRHRAEIDSELRSVLAERTSPFYDMMRYHLGWIDVDGHAVSVEAGKALRPTLCLLGCEIAGGDYRRALPAAAALELVHNFSLIHDDIQDDDRERRHRPTVWSIWGKPQAINAGTAMRVLANIALQRLAILGFSDAKQLRAHQLINERCMRLIEGQYLDISYEDRFDVTLEDYLQMISQKTGSLTACSLEMGALLATDDEQVIEGIADAGMNLGLAFQIRDDVLGIWGDESRTGKPSCSDIRHRKKSFPIMYAFDQGGSKMRTRLLEYYQASPSTEAGVTDVLNVLEALDARGRAQQMAEFYRDRALSAIDRLQMSPAARQDMQEMLDFLVLRDF